MDLYDIDYDGKLNFNEFVALKNGMKRGMFDTEDKCRWFFWLVDTDGSGFIDRTEVERYMTIFGGLTKEKVDEFIS